MSGETVSVIVAHPDDEVLGCGGTIAKLAKTGKPVHILVLADGESSRYAGAFDVPGPNLSGRKASAVGACKALGARSVELLDFPDNRLDAVDLLDIVRPIEEFVKKHSPRTVFTHHGGDVNIDHRIVHDAVITACRPQPAFPVRQLLFFEVPSSTEWRPPNSRMDFAPNWFFDITDTLDLKMRALSEYEDELRAFPHPRSRDAIAALAAWRGATVGVRAAEAFVLGRNLV